VTSYDHARKRRRAFFNSRPEAEAAAKITQNQLLNEGINASTIAPGLREEAIACQKLLASTGLTLRQAIELGMKHRPRDTDKTVSAIMEEFLASRENVRGNKKRTVDDYRYQLTKFAKDFGRRLVDTINPHEIEKWRSKPHIDYKKRPQLWAGGQRNVTLGYIATAFTYALNRNWCKTNPAKAVEKAIEEKPPIEVWTPSEAALILMVAARDCADILDFVFLALFSGIRSVKKAL
jgi:hypothetical protein